MATVAPVQPISDDPLRLRELLGRATEFACTHRLPSVVLGLAGREGDLLFPEVTAFFASALRVDDRILRLTRERVLVILADVDRRGAEQIVQRILFEFRERFATLDDPRLRVGYFEVAPGTEHLTVKEVLPAVFCAEPAGARRDDPDEDDAGDEG